MLAAERESIRCGINYLMRDKLMQDNTEHEPEWMQGFGKLKRLREETVCVQSVIDQEFEVIEPEDRR
jgi:hypothetical protein